MLFNAKNGVVPMDGTGMSYVSFGHGPRVLILIPGLSDGLETVRGKALFIAPTYRVFFDAFTVYLFNRKDVMPQGYTIRDMAEDQARAMADLGIRRACILGVSQGGMIAQYLAIDHPELVEKLVLAVTAPYADEMIREGVKERIALAEQGRHRELMIDSIEKGYSPRYRRKYRLFYPLMGHIGRPKSYDRYFADSYAIEGFDARDDLPRITCPTLIIGGSADETVGVAASYALHERIPGSELYVYEGLGHAAFEEAKDFYPRVKAFFEE